MGIVGFVILVILGTAALRRRRRRQLDIDALEARPYIFGVGIIVRYVVRHKVNGFEAFAIARSGHADSTGVRWVLC